MATYIQGPRSRGVSWPHTFLMWGQPMMTDPHFCSSVHLKNFITFICYFKLKSVGVPTFKFQHSCTSGWITLIVKATVAVLLAYLRSLTQHSTYWIGTPYLFILKTPSCDVIGLMLLPVKVVGIVVKIKNIENVDCLMMKRQLTIFYSIKKRTKGEVTLASASNRPTNLVGNLPVDDLHWNWQWQSLSCSPISILSPPLFQSESICYSQRGGRGDTSPQYFGWETPICDVPPPEFGWQLIVMSSISYEFQVISLQPHKDQLISTNQEVCLTPTDSTSTVVHTVRELMMALRSSRYLFNISMLWMHTVSKLQLGKVWCPKTENAPDAIYWSGPALSTTVYCEYTDRFLSTHLFCIDW
jgi:hypothetical protein